MKGGTEKKKLNLLRQYRYMFEAVLATEYITRLSHPSHSLRLQSMVSETPYMVVQSLYRQRAQPDCTARSIALSISHRERDITPSPLDTHDVKILRNNMLDRSELVGLFVCAHPLFDLPIQ